MQKDVRSGLVFDIENNALVDGPGIRNVIFLKGCPLRCIWCHNPESQTCEPILTYTKAYCIGCGECIKACPERAIVSSEEGLTVDRDKCNLCLKCVETCYSKAWSIIGEELTVEQVVERVRRYREFFRFSDGGITISGGEPFQQYDFLLSLIKALKADEFHIALDTTGYTDPEKLKEAARYIDLFLYDIKHINDFEHKRLTGVSNKRILENAAILKRLGKEILFRIPIIPGLNDSEQNLKETALFIAGLPGPNNVELLPFTKLGFGKYKRLQRKNLCENIEPPSGERMKEIANIFSSYSINVFIGG